MLSMNKAANPYEAGTTAATADAATGRNTGHNFYNWVLLVLIYPLVLIAGLTLAVLGTFFFATLVGPYDGVIIPSEWLYPRMPLAVVLQASGAAAAWIGYKALHNLLRGVAARPRLHAFLLIGFPACFYFLATFYFLLATWFSIGRQRDTWIELIEQARRQEAEKPVEIQTPDGIGD